jgi:uncharacterized spore protein YtfJ
VAVFVFTEHCVDVLKVDDTMGPLEKIFEKIPELIERFKPKCGSEGDRCGSDARDS